MNDFLHIQGCRQHNLKNLSLDLPKFKTIVFTGVSGSGKSSLALNTIFAEGQRRYMDTLSVSARTMLRSLPRPDVDIVEGLAPTLAFGQNSSAPRSGTTVGTLTDIYDLLSLLFARSGIQHSPKTGEALQRHSPDQIVEAMFAQNPPGSRLLILAPLEPTAPVAHFVKMGYTRLRADGKLIDLTEETLEGTPKELAVVVDRLVLKEDGRERVADSVRLALHLGRGTMLVDDRYFSEAFRDPTTGETLQPLGTADFNFQGRGVCPECSGEGGQLSLVELTLDTPDQVEELLGRLPPKQKQLQLLAWEALGDPSAALEGSNTPLKITTDVGTITTKWKGLLKILNEDLIARGSRSRVMNLPGVRWAPCPACQGGRIQPQALAVRVHSKTIFELTSLSLEALYILLQSWESTPILVEIVPRILTRLECLIELGLGYLSLNRSGNTLSAGEAQRVQLAAAIGAQLSGIVYILDEPSQGLHAADVAALASLFTRLRDQGNTLIIVEHDATLIASADHVLELHDGAITFEGTPKKLLQSSTVTGKWLSGKLQMPPPPKRPKAKKQIKIKNASAHNIHNLSLKIPLERFVALAGVSGSGKTTLATEIIYPHSGVERVIRVDQPSAAATSRAMPATYVGIMSPLRNLFASTQLSRARGYTHSTFSLSRKGGRCEACEGLGITRVQLEFLSDIWTTCEVCQGARYSFDVLQSHWKGFSIADILNLSIADALPLFENIRDIGPKLALMNELGLEYLQLGQPFSALSAGERQRLKLVSELAKRTHVPTLYILDEPATGLHLHDIEKLIHILHRLVDQKHSLLVIEHHLDILRQADHIIELGPGGGDAGGQIVFEGTPTQLKKSGTATGNALNSSHD